MEKKNWVLTVSVNRPFTGTVNLRHYLNGFTQKQAADLSAALVAKQHGDFIVGVSLSENHTNKAVDKD